MEVRPHQLPSEGFHAVPRYTTPRRPFPRQRADFSAYSMLGTIPYDPSVPEKMNVEANVEPGRENAKHAQRYWMPIWLRRTTLASFVVLFATMIASLVVVWRSNIAQGGFKTSLTSNHFAWTYGPTAILVIVLSLWRQVDYHCKMLQPWQQLRKGPADADRSVLLDYIAPLNITSFVTALRYRHWAVVASILGFSLLKLIILVSTGLLILGPTSTNIEYPVNLTTSFDERSFAAKQVNASTNPAFIGALPNMIYLSALRGDFPLPANVQNSTVLQTFDYRPNAGLRRVSTELDIFQPNVTCDIAKATYFVATPTPVPEGPDKDIYDYTGYYPKVRLESPSCLVSQWSLDNFTWFSYDNYTYWPWPTPSYLTEDKYDPSFYFQLQVGAANCSDPRDPGMNSSSSSRTNDLRQVILVANMSKPQVVHELSATICKVDYTMSKREVMHDLQLDSYTIGEPSPRGPLVNLTGNTLSDYIWSSFSQSYEQFPRPTEPVAYSRDVSYGSWPLVYTLLQTLDSPQSLDRLLSATTLRDAATEVWSGTATQFVFHNYLHSSGQNASGQAVFIEDRLHLGVASFWTMLAAFAALVCCTLCTMWNFPRSGIVPQNVGSISTSATILAASPKVQGLLCDVNCDDARTSQLTSSLRGYKFEILAGERFHVNVTGGDTNSARPSSAITQKRPWVPLPARRYMVLLTLIPPIAAVVGLEVIYRSSSQNKGMVDVTGRVDAATYLSHYLPALLMLLIATSFNAVDFSVASLAPYSVMRARSSGVPASRSVQFHALGDLPPVAVWKSLRNGHVALVCSNIASLIGGTLTIVASGLFFIDQTVSTNVAIQAPLADTFNLAWPGSSDDGNAAIRLNAIHWGNTMMPPTIWNDHVMPGIGIIDLPDESLVSLPAKEYMFRVNSLKPELECTVMPDEEVTLKHDPPQCKGQVPVRSCGPAHFTITATPSLSPDCILPTSSDQPYSFNHTTGQYDEYVEGSSNIGSVSTYPSNPWMGAFSDLPLGLNSSDAPAGCPSVGVILANKVWEGATHDDVTVLLCSQKIKHIPLDTTYQGNRLQNPARNATISPVPIDNDSVYLTNGTAGIDSLSYRPGAHFSVLTRFPETCSTCEDQVWSVAGVPVIDNFINHIMYGPNGTSIEKLSGRSNRQTFMQAVQRQYVDYMSLVIDLRFRQSISPTTAPQMVVGTMQYTASWLKVSYASKLALQIMLAAMAVLGTCAFWLAKLRGTLPRKPTSIASSMGFLAGSELCTKTLLPERAEWMAKKELDQVFAGWLFSLGWWSKQEMESSATAQRGGNEDDDEPESNAQKAKRRFGVDVGVAERLGFRERKP